MKRRSHLKKKDYRLSGGFFYPANLPQNDQVILPWKKWGDTIEKLLIATDIATNTKFGNPIPSKNFEETFVYELNDLTTGLTSFFKMPNFQQIILTTDIPSREGIIWFAHNFICFIKKSEDQITNRSMYNFDEKDFIFALKKYSLQEFFTAVTNFYKFAATFSVKNVAEGYSAAFKIKHEQILAKEVEEGKILRPQQEFLKHSEKNENLNERWSDIYIFFDLALNDIEYKKGLVDFEKSEYHKRFQQQYIDCYMNQTPKIVYPAFTEIINKPTEGACPLIEVNGKKEPGEIEKMLIKRNKIFLYILSYANCIVFFFIQQYFNLASNNLKIII